MSFCFGHAVFLTECLGNLYSFYLERFFFLLPVLKKLIIKVLNATHVYIAHRTKCYEVV